MKELSIEEKAKRYDEVREKIAIRFGSNVADEIFSQFEMSEDDRIRKSLIDMLKNDEKCYLKEIAWLEKQVEQKPNPYSGTSFEYNGHTWGMCARDNGVEILIDGHLDRVFTIDSNAKEMFIKALERVEEQNAKGYKLTDCDKNSLWEDFKAYTYCTIEQKSVIKMKTPEESLGIDSDTYNKIVDECVYGEQNPAWSEEDEMIALSIEQVMNCASLLNIVPEKIDKIRTWLESLKDRVQPQLKQEWSEEDENRINRLIAYFEDKESFTAEDDIVYANWLKSLRPQNTWKPSDEQMNNK